MIQDIAETAWMLSPRLQPAFARPAATWPDLRRAGQAGSFGQPAGPVAPASRSGGGDRPRAKPDIANGGNGRWRAQMRELGRLGQLLLQAVWPADRGRRKSAAGADPALCGLSAGVLRRTEADVGQRLAGSEPSGAATKAGAGCAKASSPSCRRPIRRASSVARRPPSTAWTEAGGRDDQSQGHVLLHQKDNILVSCRDLTPGETLCIDHQPVVLTQMIPLGHKIARRPLAKGKRSSSTVPQSARRSLTLSLENTSTCTT